MNQYASPPASLSAEPVATVRRLSEAFDRHHLLEFQDRHVVHAQLSAAIDTVISSHSYPAAAVREEGRSTHHRPVWSITAGTGEIPVLLWSQMHGDEATATKAVIDILRYLGAAAADPVVSSILSRFKLVFVPMLNPDGAETCSRRTALGIDMNRDAVALRTPEARTLAMIGDRVKPKYAFNLHDQELSTVGDTKELAAAALLAPSADPSGADTPSRIEAKRICAVMARTLTAAAGPRVARYNDSFEPRAFGEYFQGKGVATVLVESGHLHHDPAKHQARKLAFVGLMSALEGIAAGLPQATDDYDRLPFNGKRAYDVVVRNVSLAGSRASGIALDLGISFQIDTHPEEPPRLVDMGDLSIYTGVEEIDGTGVSVPQKELQVNRPFEYRTYFG